MYLNLIRGISVRKKTQKRDPGNKNFTTKLPRTTLGTGLAHKQEAHIADSEGVRGGPQAFRHLFFEKKMFFTDLKIRLHSETKKYLRATYTERETYTENLRATYTENP